MDALGIAAILYNLSSDMDYLDYEEQKTETLKQIAGQVQEAPEPLRTVLELIAMQHSF